MSATMLESILAYLLLLPFPQPIYPKTSLLFPQPVSSGSVIEYVLSFMENKEQSNKNLLKTFMSLSLNSFLQLEAPLKGLSMQFHLYLLKFLKVLHMPE